MGNSRSTPTASSAPSLAPREFLPSDFQELSLGEKLKYKPIEGLNLRKLGERVVALKIFSQPFTPDEYNEELDVFLKIESHPCLVEILGACNEEPETFVVMEYAEGGSLDALLKTEPQFNWNQVFLFALDICKGMRHLQSDYPVPTNLKPSNVLVVLTAGVVRLKVADFGLARFPANNKLLAVTKPAAYRAPDSEESNASESYAFGIILWQILTRGEPFEGLSEEEIFAQASAGARPPIPGYIPEILAVLIRQLWSQEPKDRPSFEQAEPILFSAFEMRSDFGPLPPRGGSAK